ncbi:hypothetical protein HRI_001962200 [Hibiscus trionum]|uniref:Uncharacterized protein n=1 Tax=Hibiscus trionum TaxID=183268 RepID=A0A9W7HST8_HIBTR|nr:hypothetical protein HRI_001962200 [Hibiscus trionum]
MVDGVMTRHQLAMASQTTAATQNVQEGQTASVTVQSELTNMEGRLEARMDVKFQEMRVSMMTDLHRLLEIAMEKKISMDAMTRGNCGHHIGRSGSYECGGQKR